MGEQRNLTEDNVKELRAQLLKMQEDNPDLMYRFLKQDKKETEWNELEPKEET